MLIITVFLGLSSWIEVLEARADDDGTSLDLDLFTQLDGFDAKIAQRTFCANYNRLNIISTLGLFSTGSIISRRASSASRRSGVRAA